MSCIHTTIADVVKTMLNTAADAGTLSKTFTATRVFVSEDQLRATEDHLQVRVWPAPEGRIKTITGGTRGSRRAEYPVFVGVFQKLDDPDDSSVADQYAELIEEIEDLFVGVQLTDYASAVCIASEQVALFSWEAMRQLRQYVGVVKLTILRMA